jgi:probable HAF family extracellular repeat protein
MQLRSCTLFGLLLGGTLHLAADILYSVTDLGTLGGPAFSGGSGINNLGQVTDQTYSATAYPVSFLYSNGQMINLFDPQLRWRYQQSQADHGRLRER